MQDQHPQTSKTVVSIGSAVMDVYVTSSAFQMDAAKRVMVDASAGKLELDSLSAQVGGGATNTAVGFSKMGFTARCISETGKDDLATLVTQTLEREGVDLSFLVQEKLEQTGSSVILVTPSGERMVLVYRGAASMLDPKDISEDAFQDADWVHLSNISQQYQTHQHIFELIRKYNAKLSWNPGSQLLTSLADLGWDVAQIPLEILFLNKEEWQMAGRFQEDFLRASRLVVVTDGSKGGQIFQTGTAPISYSANPVEAVDATGAGDAFVVGFVSATIRGLQPIQAAEWGAKNAASVVQQSGAKAGLLGIGEML